VNARCNPLVLMAGWQRVKSWRRIEVTLWQA
jgi:hypothetical protein